MDCLILVCERYKIHPALIFKLAFEYKELHYSNKVIKKFFLQCCMKDGKEKLWVQVVPEFVEDFCLDVLAHRVELPKISKIWNHRRK